MHAILRPRYYVSRSRHLVIRVIDIPDEWFMLGDEGGEYNEEQNLQAYFDDLYSFFIQKIRYIPRRTRITEYEAERLCDMLKEILRVKQLLQKIQNDEPFEDLRSMRLKR